MEESSPKRIHKKVITVKPSRIACIRDLLSRILVNKIQTTRLYYKILAFDNLREFAKGERIAGAVCLVQRYLKKIIAKTKIEQERKITNAKFELSKLIENILTRTYQLARVTVKYRTVICLVELTNHKRLEAITKALSRLEEKFRKTIKEALKKIYLHNKPRVKRRPPPLTAAKSFKVKKNNFEAVMPPKPRVKLANVAKDSIERVSSNIKGKSKQEILREMKLCSIAMNYKMNLTLTFKKILIRAMFCKMTRGFKRAKAIRLIMQFIYENLRARLVVINTALCTVLGKKYRNSRNNAIKDQPSIRLQLINEFKKEQVTSKFVAAIKIQSWYKNQRFAKYLNSKKKSNDGIELKTKEEDSTCLIV